MASELSLSIELDDAELTAFVESVRATALSLPLEARDRFCEEFLRLLHGDALQFTVRSSPSAAGAGDNVVRFGISGTAEILTAAVAASNEYLRVGHEQPPV